MIIFNIRVSQGFGGAEKYIIYLFSYLAHNSSISVFHFTNNKKLSSLLKKNKLLSFSLPEKIDEVGTKREIVRLLLNINKYTSSYNFILSKAEQLNPDTIILHSITEKLVLTYVLKKMKYNVIWVEHGPLFIANQSQIIKYLYRFISKHVDKVIAVSFDTKNDLVRGGVPNKKVEVIYIGIDTEYFKRDSLKRKTITKTAQEDNINIGYMGGVNEEKGILRFMEVTKLLIEKNKNYKFIVIGDGPLLGEVKKQARLYNRKYIFIGYTTNVKHYLQDIDILFLPTEHHEGIPLTILESMSMEVVVITKKIGGNGEVIDHNLNGILYTEYNVRNIVNAILDITSNNNLLTKLKKNARKKIEMDFNLHKTSVNFLSLLDNSRL